VGIWQEAAKWDLRDFYIKTPPAIEPVTLEEAKAFAKVDGTAEDTLIEGFIVAARSAIEGILGRSLINQTIVLRLDAWADTVLPLPRPPLVSVTEVRTLDEDDVATVYEASNYYIMDGNKAELILRSNATAPQNVDRNHGGFEVEYVAGYGDTADDVPQGIRNAILQWVAVMYETRVLDATKPPMEVMAYLSPFRRIKT